MTVLLSLVLVCFDPIKVQIFRILSARMHTFSLLNFVFDSLSYSDFVWLSYYDFVWSMLWPLCTLALWLMCFVGIVILLLFVWTLLVWWWHNPFDNRLWPQPLDLVKLWMFFGDILTGGEILFVIIIWKHLKEKLFYNDTSNMIWDHFYMKFYKFIKTIFKE